MIESGIEVIDAIVNNPIQSLILFGIGYVVFQMRSQRSWKRFNYNIREFMDLWSMELFPARYEYSCPEYILKKSRESQFHDNVEVKS